MPRSIPAFPILPTPLNPIGLEFLPVDTITLAPLCNAQITLKSNLKPCLLVAKQVLNRGGVMQRLQQ